MSGKIARAAHKRAKDDQKVACKYIGTIEGITETQSTQEMIIEKTEREVNTS